MTTLKKVIARILLITGIFGTFFSCSSAQAASIDYPAAQKITLSGSGGYFVEQFENATPSYDIRSRISTASTNRILTKTKSVKYYNVNSQLCWTYFLTASFNVKPGVSSTYRNSSADLKIYNASWFCSDENHSGSGTKATGSIVMKNDISIIKTITIKCDKNGNFE